jgi:hypothetical protein
MTPGDLEKCLFFWREKLSEQSDPIGRKRKVCCEPYYVPWPSCVKCYSCCHPKRTIPYSGNEATEEMHEVYDKYEADRLKQVENYSGFRAKVYSLPHLWLPTILWAQRSGILYRGMHRLLSKGGRSGSCV